MNKIFLGLAACAVGLLTSCSSIPNNKINYTPPSVGKVKQAVTSAQDTTTQAQQRVASATTRAASTAKRLTTASAHAKSVREKLGVIAKAVADQPPILTLVIAVTSEVDTLTQELLDAQAENRELQVDLSSTTTQLTSTQLSLLGANTQADQLQALVSQQTGLLNASNAKLNAALIQGAKDKHNAHVFKWIIIGCAAAISGFIVFMIFGAVSFAPPLLYLLIGLPAAVSTALFFWLG